MSSSVTVPKRRLGVRLSIGLAGGPQLAATRCHSTVVPHLPLPMRPRGYREWWRAIGGAGVSLVDPEEMLVGRAKAGLRRAAAGPAESRSLLPSIGSGREFCLFVKAGVSILVERVKLPRSEEARRDDHQVRRFSVLVELVSGLAGEHSAHERVGTLVPSRVWRPLVVRGSDHKSAKSNVTVIVPDAAGR
jgi:hypothetical protein